MGGDRPSTLWPYVRSLRYYNITGMPPGMHIGMPSATVTLVLPLGTPLDLGMPAIGRRTMTSCIAGLHDGPAAIHHDGTQRGIQADLAALGVQALFGLPAVELAGTAVGLDDILGRQEVERLLDRLADARGWSTRLALVQRFLTLRLRAGTAQRVPRPQVIRAWSLLGRSGGTTRIRDVAADVGWSSRHLAEQFAAEVGVAPKTAARLMRFSRSVSMIGGGTGLADVAARCGYADQGVAPAGRHHSDPLAAPGRARKCSRLGAEPDASIDVMTEHSAGASTGGMGTSRPDHNIWPGLTYDDPLAARAWLVAVGFVEGVLVGDDDGRVHHSEMLWPEGGRVMVSSAGRADDTFASPRGSGSVYVVVNDPDAVYAKTRALGAEPIREMEDTDYGSRGFSVIDPEGNRWSFGTYAGQE